MKSEICAASLVVALIAGTSPSLSQTINPAAESTPQGRQQFPPAVLQPGAEDYAHNANQSSSDADLQNRLQRIDSMVVERMQALNMPAYCLVVIKNGKVVFQKPYGYANLETRQPTSNDTIFGLASITKTFTALALLTLVDKGLVGLDDPLSKYIDGLTNEYKPLTIRQLASMTAGVPSKVSEEVEWRNQLDILVHTPLVSQPGSAYLYSNYSYRLLGSVIEKISGQPYLQYVESVICAPLNMRSTGTVVLLQPTGRVAQAYGDNMGQGPLRAIEYKSPAVAFSAGMLATTSNDLINYVFGLMSHKIISEDGYKTLWDHRPSLTTGQPSKWAFGWAKARNKNLGGALTLSMNGGVPGIASTIIILPESNSAVIALCNLRKPPVYQVARNAAVIAFGDAVSPPPDDDEEHPGLNSD